MNPFEMIYDALWSMALSSTQLEALVKPGNRVRYDDAARRDPMKQNIMVADVPELHLLPSGCLAANLNHNSCAASITRAYTFTLVTGDLRMTEGLTRIEWQLYCALVDWKATISTLEWEGQYFAKHVRLRDVRNGTTDPERARGLVGWYAVWGCEVDCLFSTASLKAQLAVPLET
jgi:hypothetical protein